MRLSCARHYIFSVMFCVLALTWSQPVTADCRQENDIVTCTGFDEDGFLAPGESLELTVVPQAQVRNIDTGERFGLCPLSFPTIDLGDDSAVDNQGFLFGLGVCAWTIGVGERSTVRNSGTIFTNDSLGFGVLAGAGSVVRNHGQINTLGLSSRGVLAGDGIHVTNARGGSITTAGPGAPGIEIGDAGTIINEGVIATSNAFGHGIAAGSHATVVNEGTVRVSGPQSVGLFAQGGNIDIKNGGVVEVVFNGQTDASFRGAGIDASGDDVKITNQGSVVGSFAGVRVQAAGPSRVVNNGVVRAVGEQRGNGTFAPGGGAIVLDASLSADGFEVVNTGTVAGLNGSAALRVTGGRITLANSGVIDGDVLLGDGDDFVSISNGGALFGNLDGGPGDDFLLLRGTGELAHGVTNVETLVKGAAGTWRLRGPLAFFGQANVVQGTLRLAVDARLSAPHIGITPDGTLAGTGVAEGSVFNGGTLAPGSSTQPGYLTIAGTYVQSEAGTLLVRLDPGGGGDSLAVDGAASLAGTLRVEYLRPEHGGRRFESGQVFDLLSRGGPDFSLSGSFSDVVSNSAFLKPHLISRPDGGLELHVERLSYKSAAQSKSQESLAGMFDRLLSDPPPEAVPLLDLLDYSAQAQARSALQALVPQGMVELQNVGLFTMTSVSQILSKSAYSPVFGTNFQAWFEGFDRNGHVSGSGSASVRYALRGVMAGINWRAATDVQFGLFAGRSDGGLSFEESDASGALDASIAGIKARYVRGNVIMDAAIAYGAANPSVRRTQILAETTQSLNAQARANMWSAVLQVETPKTVGLLHFIPAAGMSYAGVHLNSLDERAPMSAQVQAAAAESLKLQAAIRAEIAQGPVRPYAAATVSVEVLSRGRLANANINSIPGSTFQIHGARTDQVSLSLAAGIAYDIDDNVTAYADAGTNVNDPLDGRTATMGLTWRW